MNLETELKRHVTGEVRFENGDRALYATDSSNYRQIPIGVIVPKTKEDIVETVRICRERRVPLLSRGGGTSLAGQTCNAAVIMDMSKYFDKLLELNPAEKWARVQPGIVLDTLRAEAEKHHLTFGPDPSTHNHCTLGGMLGNNSCGVHSVMAGRTVENVLEMEILTATGDIFTVGPTAEDDLEKMIADGSPQGKIYLKLKNLRFKYQKLIRERYPHIPRRVSGYNLPFLLPENGFDVAKALTGSEGTCCTILSAKVRLVPNPTCRGLAVIGFQDIVTAAGFVPEVMGHRPIGLEAMDDLLVENMHLKHLRTGDLQKLPKGNSWLLCEIGTDEKEETRMKLGEVERAFRGRPGIMDLRTFIEPGDQAVLWKVREAGLGATAEVPGQEPTWEGWEDSAVDPSQLASYLKDLKALYAKYDFRASLYGHFGQGCVHTRINFDLFTAPGVRTFRKFIGEAADLVIKHGGSLSGEHGDGQSRAELLSKMFGPELVQAFTEFKNIWDPQGILNPGKIVNPYLITENLRLGPDYNPKQERTYFSFSEDHGSFSRAALRCVGVGECRKHDKGVMCPSYMVTREEKHSTRGRARLLWEVMQGEVIKDGLKSEELHEALDLCLACKGCKGECPVNVDMATYKAEFLAHYYKGKMRPRSAYSMGLIGTTARLGGKVPWLGNFFTQTPGVAGVAKMVGGIHGDRKIPAFASEDFRTWFNLRKRARPERSTLSGDKRPVILWTDTFNTYFHPQVAQAATRVLETVGFDVKIPSRPFCCGRPLYDYGFLSKAKKRLQTILTAMQEEIRAGIPIVVLEPSCASVFADELINLFPNDMDAHRLKKQVFLLSDFLCREAEPFPWHPIGKKALVQSHCHHRALFGIGNEERVLQTLKLDHKILDSGCCGMAGAFGFEKGHYDVSKKAAERVLIPRLAEVPADTLIIADGFSCREQVAQLTDRRAYHLAEVLAQSLELMAEKSNQKIHSEDPKPSMVPLLPFETSCGASPELSS